MMNKERSVTSSRFGRMALLGKLAGGLAGGMISEGSRQFLQGKRPALSDLLLTPENAQRLTQRLSELRGAAMKVGQLLSMDSGHLLSPQLSEILAQLREDAHQMPLGEVAQVLEQAWGASWNTHFERFTFTPIAAASIGQVHEARLKDGLRLAIKIQYPGIRRSIDSDVDNVASLLRLFSAIPKEIDFTPLLDEAKHQLHSEADYLQEASAINQYRKRLADDTRYETMEVVESLTTPEVLTMSYLDGMPIDSLVDEPALKRKDAAMALLDLALREVFAWGLVQTDPNFSNYLYQPKTGRIQLLDFGATRTYTESQRYALGNLLHASIEGNDSDLLQAAVGVGYLDENDPAAYRTLVLQLLRNATEPARQIGDYDFGRTDLASRMSDIVVEMRMREKFARLPPPEVLFLHRKLGGLYLLLCHLRAKLPVKQLVTGYLSVTTNKPSVPEQRMAV
jgi:predicted unusual protein kinase regulating ubiquinone biosynthesis (AarF/ABC1/UbiB family)